MNDAIEEVIALVRGELSKNRVLVQTHLARELTQVHADRVQLQQVMLILILNAIEAMASVDGDAGIAYSTSSRTPFPQDGEHGFHGNVNGVPGDREHLSAPRGALFTIMETVFTIVARVGVAGD